MCIATRGANPSASRLIPPPLSPDGAHDMLDNLPRGTICIEDMEIGMSRYLLKTITDRDIELFAEVSTDRNPVHLDDDYARDTIFGGRIAHGVMCMNAGNVSIDHVSTITCPAGNRLFLQVRQQVQRKSYPWAW